MDAELISIVTPAYNEAANLPLLHPALCQVCAAHNLNWEWIIVDDHSSDETFAVVQRLAQADRRVRGVRLARNSGSHTAILCGLAQARGQSAIVMASDLQDPVDLIPELVARWRAGAQVVWAEQTMVENKTAQDRFFSEWYYRLMRRVAGVNTLPPRGADAFLIDRVVIDSLKRFGENNLSVFATIGWMGFRQTGVPYVKQPRKYGKSGWTLGKKLKLAADSIISYSYLPIRLFSIVGFLTAILGFLYAAFLFFNAWLGKPPEGWSSLMVALLVLSGVQMAMLGVMGEYLWRTLDESRRRPRYLIEAVTGEPRA
jgi:dolichol-phosphate mannosyltransferase